MQIPAEMPAAMPAEMVEWLDWTGRRCFEHVGDNGWRIRTCRDTLQSVIEVAGFRQKLREMARDVGGLLVDDAGKMVRAAGRLWVLEPMAKHILLRLCDLSALGGLFSDLAEARNEAVRGIMAEQSKILEWVRDMQARTMSILEEDLRHRVPTVVN